MAEGWFKFKGQSPYPELAANPQRSRFTYGVKSDRGYRMPWLQGPNLQDEKEVVKFVAETLNIPEPNIPISEWLKDGQILLKLLDKMAPGSVKQMNTKRAQMSSNENIQKFIKRCKELGFEDNQLFEVSDLVDGKNVPKLVNCLKHIRKELLTRNKLQFYI